MKANAERKSPGMWERPCQGLSSRNLNNQRKSKAKLPTAQALPSILGLKSCVLTVPMTPIGMTGAADHRHKQLEHRPNRPEPPEHRPDRPPDSTAAARLKMTAIV